MFLRSRGKKNEQSISTAKEPTTVAVAVEPPAKDSRPRALVVGGGPAGALSAKALSERGFAVDVYEAYPHPSGSTETSKAYVISLNPRGQRALKRVGVDPLGDDLLEGAGAVASSVMMSHPGSNSKGARPMRLDQPNVIVRRQKLASSLLEVAIKAGARVHCDHRLTEIDFDGRKATFLNKNGSTRVEVEYDLLVGADGVQSATRALLAKQIPSFEVLRTEDDDLEYQVAVLPGWRDVIDYQDNLPLKKSLADTPAVSTHSWSDPGANSSAFAFPLAGGQTLVCAIFPGGKLGAMKEAGTDGSGYDSPLASLLHDWKPEARREMATQLAARANVPATGGKCVWTSALGHPESGVVLVGDSAHGMWPSLGQGCNAALESAAVLADALDATGPDAVSYGVGVRAMDRATPAWERAEAVAIEYNGLRYDDAMAAVDLTFGGYGSRRSRSSGHIPILFKLQLYFVMVLHMLTAKLVPVPALFRTMRGDDVSYAALKRHMKVEKAALCVALICTAASAGYVAWGGFGDAAASV